LLCVFIAGWRSVLPLQQPDSNINLMPLLCLSVTLGILSHYYSPSCDILRCLQGGTAFFPGSSLTGNRLLVSAGLPFVASSSLYSPILAVSPQLQAGTVFFPGGSLTATSTSCSSSARL
jgi:hypothetical protein